MSGGVGETSTGDRGGEVRLTEPQRVAAVVRLRDRYASDEITLDEFSRALDSVLAAQTTQELSRASPTRELPVPASRVSWLGAEGLQQHLLPGEEVLWVGRPEGSFVNLTRGSALAMVPIVAFLVFFEAFAVAAGAPAPFLLFALIILVVGGYNVFGRLVLQGRRTVYAVTTRRIVRIIRRSSGDQTDSKLLRTIRNISVTQGKHDRGTVTFGDPPAVQRSNGLSIFTPQGATEPISFINVAEPASLARLIGSLQTYE
jgi:hypothetical protein